MEHVLGSSRLRPALSLVLWLDNGLPVSTVSFAQTPSFRDARHNTPWDPLFFSFSF
jgi:hypothetical protein